MAPHTKQYRIRQWIHGRKIKEKFTAQNIAEDLDLLSHDVSAFLKWQTFVKHAGKVPGRGDTNVWQKIAEVPVC